MLDSSNLRCVPIQGYFDNSTQICVQCPSVCSSCTTAKICTFCVNNYFLRVDNYCYTDCLVGFYPQNTTWSCEKCPLGCTSCLSSILCLACNEGFYLRSSLCYTSCLVRTFGDSLTRQCLSCSFDCYTCNELGSCLTCNSTTDYRKINNLTKRCDPLDGYF